MWVVSLLYGNFCYFLINEIKNLLEESFIDLSCFFGDEKIICFGVD